MLIIRLCLAFQLDVVGHIDTLVILLSPRQVHLLMDMFGSVSGGGKHPSVQRITHDSNVTTWRNRVNAVSVTFCVKEHRYGRRIERTGRYSKRTSIVSTWN